MLHREKRERPREKRDREIERQRTKKEREIKRSKTAVCNQRMKRCLRKEDEASRTKRSLPRPLRHASDGSYSFSFKREINRERGRVRDISS